MQTEARLFGVIGPAKKAPEELMGQCRDARDAVRLTATLSGLTDETICERLGIDKGHWSRIMRGRAHFPLHKMAEFMRLCGSLAVIQQLASEMGYEIQERSKDERIRQLEAKLAELKAA